MIRLKKVLHKGYSNGSGFVHYLASFKYSSITIEQINQLLREIQKDFPNTTEKHVSIKINDNVLKAIFFTLDLPPKDSGLFDEENYLDF